nr:type II secretion system protein [uncultured Dethiosulfovibrio sp.]
MARRGFTLFEMMLVVALIGIMATLVVSRIAPGEPDGLSSINRYMAQARSMAMDGGPLILEVNQGELKTLDLTEKEIPLSVKLPSGTWSLQPERIVVFKDGTVTPGTITLEGKRGKETYLLSVTARAYEAPQ